MRAKRMRTTRQQLIEEPATLADRTANGAGADTEPARELALEEHLHAIEQQLAVNLGYFHDEKRFLLETLQAHITTRIAAIRVLSSPDHADAGKVEGDGWLPIETAPKDGTVVLAFCKDEGVVSVRFEQKHSYGRFLVCGVSDSYYGEFGVYPTHWRPLPSAPASEVEGDDGRPCSMDEFMAALFNEKVDEFDVSEAAASWVNGDWKGALSYLTDIPTHWRPLPSAPSEGAE